MNTISYNDDPEELYGDAQLPGTIYDQTSDCGAYDARFINQQLPLNQTLNIQIPTHGAQGKPAKPPKSAKNGKILKQPAGPSSGALIGSQRVPSKNRGPLLDNRGAPYAD